MCVAAEVSFWDPADPDQVVAAPPAVVNALLTVLDPSLC